MPSRGIDRREFLKAALVIGGTGALSACVAREGEVDVPRGDPDALPERQFAWNEVLPTGPHGNVKIPNHQLILLLDYRAEGVPTAGDRETVEAALRSLERAYQWGAGDEFNPGSTRGLLSMLGYAPRYFDRFDADLPDGVGMQRPEAVIEELGEDADPDRADAVLLLSSDEVQVLLGAEQALRGGFDALNGVSVDAALTDVFEVVDRRTGFLGVGRPARNLDADVPEHSPTAMGYRSGFKDNQATEDAVAASIGAFADGTTFHLSRLTFDLDSWYDRDETDRVHRMFSPEHTPREVGEIGEHLGGRSRISQETAERTPEDAREHGTVGHTQKVARARDDEFEPTLLRRSEGVSTDLPGPSMNFGSLQRYVEDFLDVRRAMNGVDVDADLEEEDDGIRGFVDVRSRGTYLIPPRSLRALPTPDGGV
jgi:hypothetical protein